MAAAVLAPLRRLDSFARLGVRPPRGALDVPVLPQVVGRLASEAAELGTGVLMHGPPGCGKTSLARLLATAARANFVEVHAPQIVTAVVGEPIKSGFGAVEFPNETQIKAFQNRYITALRELFDTHKAAYGAADAVLEIE